MRDYVEMENVPIRKAASKNIIRTIFISTEPDLITFLEFRVEFVCVYNSSFCSRQLPTDWTMLEGRETGLRENQLKMVIHNLTRVTRINKQHNWT